MDVAHVTTVHNAMDARIFWKQARTAAAAGLATVVIGPHDGAEVIDGVVIHAIPRPRWRLLRRLLSPIRALVIATRLKARIVHIHDPELLPAALILKVLGYRLVYDIHEYYSEILTARLAEGPLKRISRATISAAIERVPSRLVDAVVFPTNALKNAICGDPRAVVLVNHIRVETARISVEEPSGVDHDLVFMGSLSPFRAQPLLRMLELILHSRPEARLLLLGIPDATKEWMLAHAPTEAVRRAMTFHPKVPHDQVPRVIARARVGFNYHPMERRFLVAIPMKVYEYMAAGVAVVTTRFPELEQQLVDGRDVVFVDGDDQEAYAAAVVRLLENTAERERIANNGRSRINADINWEASEAPKLLALYAKLMTQDD